MQKEQEGFQRHRVLFLSVLLSPHSYTRTYMCGINNSLFFSYRTIGMNVSPPAGIRPGSIYITDTTSSLRLL